MGWWSANVMGGDTPYDYRGDFEGLCGIGSSFWDRFQDAGLTKKGQKLLQTRYNKNLTKLVNYIEKKIAGGSFRADDYTNIAYQVLGAQLMECGANFPDWLRGRCIEAAIDDEWSQDQAEDDSLPEEKKDRFHAMLSYIDDVLNYEDGKPTELSSPDMGLMFQIATKLSKGEAGMVNREKH